MYGLAQEAARHNVTALVIVHFFSGYRRTGDIHDRLLRFIPEIVTVLAAMGMSGFVEHPQYPTWP